MFPAGLKFVEVLAAFIAAAAAGRVEEQVRLVGGRARELRTVVCAENGYSWTSTIPLGSVGIGDSFATISRLWQRAQHGNHDYPPWAAST